MNIITDKSTDRFTLKSKRILVISLQRWGDLFLSKHHYAVELSKRGNIVYFLNPPDIKGKFFEITHVQDYANLYIINYNPIFRGKKYLPAFVFNKLKVLQAYIIRKLSRVKFDIVWSFDSLIFDDLNWFGARIKIYHPVDRITAKVGYDIAKSASIIFSESKTTLEQLKDINKEKIFINHGVSEEFLKYSKITLLSDFSLDNIKIKVGYVGNLFNEFINRDVFKVIIEENQNVEFTFWGPYLPTDSNIGSWVTRESLEFITFLKEQRNVILKGPCKVGVVAREIREMNAFIICYVTNNDYYKGVNPHKTLEYLSTGKVIISSYLETYSDLKDVILMLKDDNMKLFPVLFKNVINNLNFYNSLELQKKRIGLALDNSYAKQVDKIETVMQTIFKLKN